jgi:type IV secretion system protein VirB3
MSAAQSSLPGFEVPLHRALTEPILMGGAPRALVIVIGTTAAAIGLGLQQWVAGLALWAVGHTIAVLAARRDPDVAVVLVRHLRQRGWWSC